MKNGLPSCLVDTNVLLYPHDPEEREKGRLALHVLHAINEARVGYTSPQILGEFYVGMCRLVPRPEHARILDRLRYYLQYWRVCPLDTDTVMEAVRGVERHRLAYYDALVWATARRNGVRVVLSEDCQDRRTIEGVLFHNPFECDFSLDDLV